eukprot:CAMPEP_0172413198 /NCGR_PEP_ID=MMETSP1061-20121228/78300_1 /TAXON_ID=37318 /ORGANISM="Pseudo-nitzschia pungens, Strain cf. pungens" /LENGTH=144 /DNA_ID=CAMNT_0013149457 /DNA_START=101 /DNA_END=536 /DNA_ORIENTATION=-
MFFSIGDDTRVSISTFDRPSPCRCPAVFPGSNGTEPIDIGDSICANRCCYYQHGRMILVHGDGVSDGCFDVLCVNEGGHVTELEVITVVSTLMGYRLKNSKEQLMLAGDPMQLGPIITSDLCKKFNLDQSHIQRILKTIPATEL